MTGVLPSSAGRPLRTTTERTGQTAYQWAVTKGRIASDVDVPGYTTSPTAAMAIPDRRFGRAVNCTPIDWVNQARWPVSIPFAPSASERVGSRGGSAVFRHSVGGD
jgi:hypothetical protein